MDRVGTLKNVTLWRAEPGRDTDDADSRVKGQEPGVVPLA